MPLTNIINQKKALRIIESMVTGHRLPHALLFWGPAGVGKSYAAIELARWLNCEMGKEGPCGNCASCLQFATLEHPHFSYQIPLPAKALVASDSGELSNEGTQRYPEILKKKAEDPYRKVEYSGAQFILIGQIRSLLQWAAKRSFEDKPRLALIDHAGKLKEEAANALLKLLEEPPPDFILVLTAESPEDILPTLQSRCHLVEFSNLSDETIQAELGKRGLQDPSEVNRISHLANGNLSRAIDFFENMDKTNALLDLAINIIRHALSRNPLEMNSWVDKWEKEDLSGRLFILEVISAWFRDALLIKTADVEDNPKVIHTEHIELLQKFVKNCPDADFILAVKHVEEARRSLQGNTLAPLTLLVLARRLYSAVYRKKPA
ncbi:hypothetical protein CEE37_00615 [candidate division LCP-89 bacterium B3_LCP]|uniref:DNA polymerase III subunit delta n=1 Tax=candidate division LCP-89 bacterium B3_LCP TaxID=2012998 RepID=A0A532V4T5_UNCL8|nr:MAG: hypothetical protein CEE37_00615 [candidate division LCP-89 bacterium B3_LCP]